MTAVTLTPEHLDQVNETRREDALNALRACPAVWSKQANSFMICAPRISLEALTHVPVARRDGTSRRVRVGLPNDRLGGFVCDCGREHAYAPQARTNGTTR